MYEFACINGHKTERFVDYETTSLVCDCDDGNAPDHPSSLKTGADKMR